MRTNRTHQPLTYDVRLPDEAQADALRLLDVSRCVVNQTLAMLWPHLDEFAHDRVGPAWKQVGKYMGSPQYHGDRQWRCESEVVGRVLRAQAERKQAFDRVVPILTDGFIRPKTEKRPAGKNRPAIKEAITLLQKSLEEDEISFVALQNVVEQCCNYFFQHDRFPATYEELQPLPLLKVGMLTYAGDDGGEKGQAYRLALDLEQGVARLRFRYPDEAGVWHWRKVDTIILLPECVKERLSIGKVMAPTLREEHRADGSRIAVLDLIVEVEKAELAAWEQVERVLGADWGVHTLLTATAVDEHNEQVGRPLFLNTGGFDGRQARTRRQIDELKKKVAKDEQERDALPPEHPKRAWFNQKLAVWRGEIDRCWRKYEHRNRALAHLASNVLLLLAWVHGCSLLSMESLKTLKTTGRGRGVKGRWRNYRNNTTIRGEIWRLLRYKCHLIGLRFHTEPPRGTSHTCPHCGQPAKTYRSPSDRNETVKWGRWMSCENCHYNGDRDYCASVNIARLGVAYLVQMKQTGKARSCSITDPRVKPVSYTGLERCCCCHRRGTTLPETFGERSVTILVGLVQLFSSHLRRRLFFCDCVDSSILLRIGAFLSNGVVESYVLYCVWHKLNSGSEFANIESPNMLLQSRLLSDTVQLASGNQILFLNSAADPFVSWAAQQIGTGGITLAEDNIASLHMAIEAVKLTSLPANKLRHIAFHEYSLLEPASTMDVALMNLLYQPNNTWMIYGLQVAAYALKAGGSLYIVGAKDRGVLSMAKRMQAYFGNVETLAISKGHRVVRSRVGAQFIASKDKDGWEGMPALPQPFGRDKSGPYAVPAALVFADGKLDEGTCLLLDALEVQPADEALDIGCGSGFIGLHIARVASKGYVTMVDASLATVAVARQSVEESGLTNIRVVPSDGAQAILQERFDLVVTNPPFHQGGIQTSAIAERFIREAAQVLRPRGRFYLVANRFLKYEPALRACFKVVEEVGGNTRFKVLRALS